MAEIIGSSNNDFIDASGINALLGLEGNDTILGAKGDDSVSGGQGSDLIASDQGNDTVQGDEGDDQLFGGQGDDQLFGNIGNDDIFGNEGNDSIDGSLGNDTGRGGIGNDLVFGGVGDDQLFGDPGEDLLRGGSGSDALSGGEGNDRLEGDEDNDRLLGDEGNDVILGGGGNDSLRGGVGGDTLDGSDGNDFLLGDLDTPQPVIELDTEVPLPGLENFLSNDLAQDFIVGGAGNDTAVGSNGNDDIFGNLGDDQLFGNQGADDMYAGQGNDTMRGGQDNDQMYGDQGNDVMLGDIGNDQVAGGEGNDSLYGNQGNDVVYGNEGNDSLYGGQDNDTLQGGKENDLLFGDLGDDNLAGELGSDTLTGGQGRDIFGISKESGGATVTIADFVTDFEDTTDFIELASGLAFTDLNIFQGTDVNAANTVIQDKLTGQFLLVLNNVNVAAITQADFLPAPPTPPTPTAPPATGTIQFSAATYQYNENGAPVGVAVTVTRTGGSSGEATAQITLAGGTATPGVDYTNTPITVEFEDGEDTAQTITIPITNDIASEPNETVNLTLGNVVGATLGAQRTATWTIVDDDKAGTLEFTAPTFTINEDGTTSAAVTVKRTGGSAGDVTATVTLANGTAIGGTDFTNTPITVSFFDGQTADQTVTIPLTNDALVEGNETLTATLGSPTGGATIGTQRTATVNIADDDVPTVSIVATGDATAAEQGQTTGGFTITNSGATAVVVNYTVAGDAATDNSDYTITSSNPADPVGQITVVGNSTATLTVTPVDDVVLEGSETVDVALTPSAGYNVDATKNTASVSIIDNDVPIVEIVAANPNAREGGEQGLYTVSRRDGAGNPITTGALTVNYTVGGSARVNNDYDPLTGTIVIAEGQSTANISLNPVDDATVELTESVKLTLSNSTAYSVGPLKDATVNIKDNEAPTMVIFASDDRAEEADLSSGTFLIQRLGDLSGSLTVNYAVAGTSSATPGVDYVQLGSSVTFAPEQRDAFVTVAALNDTGSEPEPPYEELKVDLVEGAGYSLGFPVSNTVYIVNNGGL
ncbi:Calx-beta domain-containing protein [Microcoleus sp. FACHB-672]|uniref:Calx-beta domain-containing protein n=1 Tax=Microcoleus sp. FACHB-672 TaxID=2692825 RepID=UPI001682A30C|nr:Calx-beta domain-containing protein [Microcoleus sp. FACHB-672]MBD2039366.1 hypothetical protein [Microcoleus sp. FACHB-672]